MSMIDHEVQAICTRLYFGWVDKKELSSLSRDPALYRAVQDRLAWLGMELIDRPECPWYVVRIIREHDSFTQFHKRYQSLQGRHLALLLILYSKLLLPRRIGQISIDIELDVTFQELYQTYGPKFVPRRRKTTSEGAFKSLLRTLSRFGFIVKQRQADIYHAGPAMYMLHDELLTDIAEASLQVLFGLEQNQEHPDSYNLNEEMEEV